MTMFNTFIVQPIFNILTLIYALLPGHNFGVAIIVFTILVRLALWPLVKKQLHSTKKMRELQPELREIKKRTKGDRAKESELTMALYKEREVNPFSSLGLLILQLPILLALYAGISKIVNDPQAIIDFSYPFVQNLPSMKELAADIGKLDFTLFGAVDLSAKAYSNGVIYWPAMFLVLASAFVQYLTSKQLMVTDKNAKTLRQIMKQSSTGEQADQAEVSAAVSRMMVYFIPAMIFFISVGLAAALSLYWLTSGLVAYFQQKKVLGQDKVELEAAIDDIPVEAEVLPKPKTKKKTSTKKGTRKKKRR
jgi:YidC/Oxa1 family membrane protein insertase